MRPGSSVLLALTSLTTFRAPVRLTGPSILLYYEPAVSSTFVLFDLPFGRFLSITHYPADDCRCLPLLQFSMNVQLLGQISTNYLPFCYKMCFTIYYCIATAPVLRCEERDVICWTANKSIEESTERSKLRCRGPREREKKVMIVPRRIVDGLLAELIDELGIVWEVGLDKNSIVRPARSGTCEYKVVAA